MTANIEGDTSVAGVETAAVVRGKRKTRRSIRSIITNVQDLDQPPRGARTQKIIEETHSTSLEI